MRKLYLYEADEHSINFVNTGRQLYKNGLGFWAALVNAEWLFDKVDTESYRSVNGRLPVT